MRVAFCGLGSMGAPMATRLLDAGHELVVWNRTADRAQPFRDRGVRVAATPAEAAREAEVTITMLADAPALESVVFGEDGLASALRPGGALIDMSTAGPNAARSLTGRLPDGIDVLDAPVKGGPARAARGELKILVGGSEEAFERWSPFLSALGEPRHLGSAGSGAAAKVLNNYAVISLVSVMCEAMNVADALGLSEDEAVEILKATPLKETMERQWPRAVGDSPPSFRLRLAAKDLALAVEAARAEGRAVAIGAQALQRLVRALEAGLGDHDQTAVLSIVRGRAAGPQG